MTATSVVEGPAVTGSPGPVGMLERLDLISDTGHGSRHGMTVADVEALRTRESAFDHVHLGLTDVPIGGLLDLIHDVDHLLPPRTGHLGNWSEIVAGRAGAMDFNNAVCAQGHGYPLIYAFNQTEDAGLTSGDWVYLPGSVVRDGERTLLPLRTWNGTAFVERDRSRPLFTPVVQTEVDGRQVPLVAAHWDRMQQEPGFDFRLEAGAVHDAAGLVRRVLTHLVEQALREPNRRRAFGDLFSGQALADGTVERVEVDAVDGGLVLGDVRYASVDALVDATLLPFDAVADPHGFADRIPSLPGGLPLMSTVLSGILSGVLCTHYPYVEVDRARMTTPFNPHVHWGARHMAGYPPVRRGYFADKSTLRSHRRLCRRLLDGFDEIDPLVVVLAPASVFGLCPRSSNPDDAGHVARLIERVRTECPPPLAGPDLQRGVDGVVRAWREDVRGLVSDYFLGRFAERQGLLSARTATSSSTTVEPAGFRELTFAQACAVVGALHETAQHETAGGVRP